MMLHTSTTIPDGLRDLLDRPIVAALATLMPDGHPQVTPVWFMYDGEHIVVNTARGRQKDRNMKRDTKVTLLIIDPQNQYHWAELRGTIVEVTEEGAYEVIKALAKRYTGRATFTLSPGEVRVTYKIALQKVNGN
mgnify:CR=1 FL=1